MMAELAILVLLWSVAAGAVLLTAWGVLNLADEIIGRVRSWRVQ